MGSEDSTRPLGMGSGGREAPPPPAPAPAPPAPPEPPPAPFSSSTASACVHNSAPTIGFQGRLRQGRVLQVHMPDLGAGLAAGLLCPGARFLLSALHSLTVRYQGWGFTHGPQVLLHQPCSCAFPFPSIPPPSAHTHEGVENHGVAPVRCRGTAGPGNSHHTLLHSPAAGSPTRALEPRSSPLAWLHFRRIQSGRTPTTAEAPTDGAWSAASHLQGQVAHSKPVPTPASSTHGDTTSSRRGTTCFLAPLPLQGLPEPTHIVPRAEHRIAWGGGSLTAPLAVPAKRSSHDVPPAPPQSE